MKIDLHKLLLGLAFWALCAKVFGQDTSLEPSKSVPVIFTTQQDHQEMLKQLGIAKLRPGRDSNQESPRAANYDESKANPFPVLPDVLLTLRGEKVSSAEQWWQVRRPELVELLEREVYGRVPANIPAVKWEVRETREITVGGKSAIQQHILGVVDNSNCPEISVEISMSLTLPKDVSGPVPVLLSFGWTPFEPSPFSFGGRNAGNTPRPPSREDKLIVAGWGCAILNPNTVQDDTGGFQRSPFAPRGATDNATPKGAGLTRGIIGLTNRGQPRKPDDWGALRAWGWGASRALDYFETLPQVDSRKITIAGVSRYGKSALVAMAFDQRFAGGLIASSGIGGTALYRRNFGESLENLAGTGAYHWMAGNYIKYSAEESIFGSLNAGDLPVDSHMTIALCAPRLTFISHGIPDKGDAQWLDHQGSFMAAIAAQPVYRLLGGKDLGRTDNYMEEKMPPVNVDLLKGQLAWRQHDGGHTDEPNLQHFINWANHHYGREEVNFNVALRPSEKSSASAEQWTTPGGAEVPEVVRIKRPTLGDIEHAKTTLKKFIEGTDERTRKVLEEYPSLLEVRPPVANSAIVPSLAPFFQQKHEANKLVAKEGKADVLFIGDSITDFWRNENGPFAGKAILDKYFGELNIANFGIAGDTTQGVLFRLQNGEGEGIKPRAIMLLIGTNNIGRNSAPEIAEGIGAVVLKLQQSFPKAKILLLGLFPRGAANDSIRATVADINQRISKLNNGSDVKYLDIGKKFLDDEGNIPKDIMTDALHPSTKGYEIWALEVQSILKQHLE